MAEITWAPYFEKMKELLAGLQPVGIKSCDGRDSAAAENIATPAGCGTVQAFTAEKIEKIVLGKLIINDEKQIGLCAIFPAEGYELPIFFSRWAEDKTSVGIFVDLIPTVDCLVDEPYRKKFCEPLGPLWEKFASLPGIAPEEHDGLRACASIIYTAAVIPIEREGMRLAALAPHTEYLKSYIEHCTSAAAAADVTKRAEMQRKIQCVRTTLKEYFISALAAPAGKACGAAMAEQLPDIFF
ncbi:MAG: hypothetical protein JW832_01675 [Deltaproteobacteria bacterium]|nr:hypothetical protein [Deltaproteobacteria bacterium]